MAPPLRLNPSSHSSEPMLLPELIGDASKSRADLQHLVNVTLTMMPCPFLYIWFNMTSSHVVGHFDCRWCCCLRLTVLVWGMILVHVLSSSSCTSSCVRLLFEVFFFFFFAKWGRELSLAFHHHDIRSYDLFFSFFSFSRLNLWWMSPVFLVEEVCQLPLVAKRGIVMQRRRICSR